MQPVKALLFDLGGVLIDFTGIAEVAKLLPAPQEPVQLRARWIASPAIIAFEKGLITGDEFATRFVDEWRISQSPERFLNTFRDWMNGPLPGVIELLEHLRPHFTLACLSNTNSLHWDEMFYGTALDKMLDEAYASFQLGLVKPQHELFQAVCDDLSLAPGEILFFDDSETNVESAQCFGLRACQVFGPSDIRKALSERALWPD